MKLVKCDGCDSPICDHRLVHETGYMCLHGGMGSPCHCRPVKARRMWMVYMPDGEPYGDCHEARRSAMANAALWVSSWEEAYRRGWRCRRVLVIEEAP